MVRRGRGWVDDTADAAEQRPVLPHSSAHHTRATGQEQESTDAHLHTRSNIHAQVTQETHHGAGEEEAYQ